MEPGGAGVKEDILNVPVRGSVLGDSLGAPEGDDIGQIVVEIAMVEVTTTVE